MPERIFFFFPFLGKLSPISLSTMFARQSNDEKENYFHDLLVLLHRLPFLSLECVGGTMDRERKYTQKRRFDSPSSTRRTEQMVMLEEPPAASTWNKPTNDDSSFFFKTSISMCIHSNARWPLQMRSLSNRTHTNDMLSYRSYCQKNQHKRNGSSFFFIYTVQNPVVLLLSFCCWFCYFF